MRMLGCMTTSSEWAQRVAAWKASGLSGREFCRELEYTSQDLSWWSSRLRRRATQSSENGPRVPLARVVRSVASTPTPTAASVVIELAGARVELRAGVDRTTLVTVFEALRAAVEGGSR
jgi:hypothetical protein